MILNKVLFRAAGSIKLYILTHFDIIFYSKICSLLTNIVLTTCQDNVILNSSKLIWYIQLLDLTRYIYYIQRDIYRTFWTNFDLF